MSTRQCWQAVLDARGRVERAEQRMAEVSGQVRKSELATMGRELNRLRKALAESEQAWDRSRRGLLP